MSPVTSLSRRLEQQLRCRALRGVQCGGHWCHGHTANTGDTGDNDGEGGGDNTLVALRSGTWCRLAL